MLRARTIVVAFAAITALGGCSTTYRETLDQKLEGKTPEEKRIILARECGAEIGKGVKKDDPANLHHSENVKQICEEMTGQKVNVIQPGGS